MAHRSDGPASSLGCLGMCTEQCAVVMSINRSGGGGGGRGGGGIHAGGPQVYPR